MKPTNIIFIAAFFYLITSCVSSKNQSETNNIITKAVSIPSSDYKIMATYAHPVSKEPFPLVVMHHGLGGNREEGGMFARYAQTLAQRGIASIRMDFVGCGESELPFKDNTLTNMIADSYTTLDWALSNLNVDKNRLGLLGYSMGGRIALLMTAEENPYTDRKSPYNVHVFLAPGTKPFPKDFNAQYEEAKLNGFYSYPWFGGFLELGEKWYEEMIYANDFVQNITGIRENSLVISGTEDALLPSNKKTAQIIGAEFTVIPEATHGYGFFSDQPEVRDAVVESVSEFFIENL